MYVKMKNRVLTVVMTVISFFCFLFGIGAYNRTIAAKADTLLSYTDEQLATYDVVTVSDLFGANVHSVPAASGSYTETEKAYTKSAANTTGSVVFKFKLGINSTDDVERLITLRKNSGSGYRFWFGTHGWKVMIGTADNWTIANKSDPVVYITGAPSEYEVEIGAIDLLDCSGVWQYVKINDTFVLSANQPLIANTTYPHVCVGGNDTAAWTLTDIDDSPVVEPTTETLHTLILGDWAKQNSTADLLYIDVCSKNLPLEINFQSCGLTIQKNGVTTKFGSIYAAGQAGLLAISSVNATAGTKITIPQGASFLSEEITYTFGETFNAWYNGTSWQTEEYTAPVSVTIVHNGKTVKTGDVVWTTDALNAFYDGDLLTDSENIFIGYVYGDALYRAIGDIEKPDTAITVEAVTINFSVLDGASVRTVKESTGIRFIAKIFTNEYVTNYSILFTETATAAEGFDKTSLAGKKYLDIGTHQTGFKQKKNGDGSISFAVALTGLTTEQYDLSFSARGCVEIEYADGTKTDYYTDYAEEKHARSIQYVANAALNDTTAEYTAEQKSVLFTYLGKNVDTFAYCAPESGIYTLGTEEGYRGMATAADIKTYFDAGYDYLQGENWTYESWKLHDTYGGNKAQADLFYLLDAAAEYCETYNKTAKDCKVLVHIQSLWGLMEGYYTTLESTHDQYVNIKDGTNVENWKSNLKAYINHIKNYTPSNDGINCFAGILLRDEPTGAMLADYTYWYNYIADDLGLLNEGYYLSGALLGEMTESSNKDALKVEGYSYKSDESYYEVYIQTFINGLSENVKAKTMLKFDNYSLLTVADRKILSSGSSYMKYRDSFYSNMQLIAEQGMQDGIVLQAFAQYDKSKVEEKALSELEYYGKLDHEGYISLQAYAAMAYGFENIGYYSYNEHFRQTSDMPFYDASFMYNESTQKWEKQAMYDYVKNTNAEIKKLQTVYTGFDWQGTKLVKGSSVTNGFGKATDYEAYKGVLSAMTATQDAIAGCFTMGENVRYEGFMVANMGLPTDKTNSRYYTTTAPSANSICMTFDGCTKAIVYLDGEPQVMELSNGVLELTLEFGEGAFVIPLA